MNGNKLFLDTDIILYLLSGDETIAELMDKKQSYISVITKMELLVFPKITTKEHKNVEKFIQQCNVINITEQIKLETIKIRKKYKKNLT